jgi:hypothetical protein
MFLMAGPLSSEEIEDVVSSVRRLVSNEQSARAVTRDLAAERFLLTPALRVVSEISPLAPLLLDIRVTEPTVRSEPLAEPTDPDLPSGEGPGQDASPDAMIEADWEDELWAAPGTVSLGEVALGAEEAEVVAASDDPAKSYVEPEPGAEAWDHPDQDWAEDEPVPFIPLRRRAEHLAARLAAGEVMDPALTDLSSFAAGQGSVDDVVHADDIPSVDAMEETVPDDPDLPGKTADEGEDDILAGTTQRMPTEIIDADGTPLAVLDEAALQEIVRQMIRDELQGPMGERITRNVRKLVRAEINRALVARDLD